MAFSAGPLLLLVARFFASCGDPTSHTGTTYNSKARVNGTLITALEAAPKNGWLVADIEKDWKVVFAP